MFKRSKNKQIDLFENVSSHLSKRKQKVFDSAFSWHNIFYKEIVEQIDEKPYSVLYHHKMGRPNSPIRILIGMMILKEGNGWSDEQLFEECRYNLMIMRSLGLVNLNDDIPVESTYYEFRKLLGEHQKKGKGDLLKETFQSITSKQVSLHKVSGRKIRMDSKLINSNIAKSNRLQLIVESLRKYIQKIDFSGLETRYDKESYELLLKLKTCSASNITYPLNGDEKKSLLLKVGILIRALLAENKGSEQTYYQILKRVYEEQYEEIVVESNENENENEVNGNKKEKLIVPRKPKDIPSSSVQSIHDPEAAYRSKGKGASKQTVSGYHVNITESCSPEDELNLILDVETVKANVCEDQFLVETIKESTKVLEQGNAESKIEETITDGGYDSIANRKAMLAENQPRWSIAKMKGGRHIFNILKNESGNIEVFDKKSGQQLAVLFSEKLKKYIIIKESGARRYMTIEMVENYINHQSIVSQVNEESYNLRASVESTIHQSFHRLKKRNKIVYRGQLKCHWYALSRAFWVNLVRIVDKRTKKAEKAIQIWILILMHSLVALRCKYQNI